MPRFCASGLTFFLAEGCHAISSVPLLLPSVKYPFSFTPLSQQQQFALQGCFNVNNTSQTPPFMSFFFLHSKCIASEKQWIDSPEDWCVLNFQRMDNTGGSSMNFLMLPHPVCLNLFLKVPLFRKRMDKSQSTARLPERVPGLFVGWAFVK